VQISACDVADRVQLQALIAGVPEDRPLRTVIHTAGVLDDGVISTLDSERLARVMAPKVNAAINLHELTHDTELILFSSIVATLECPGQGNYAAANAFMDALAHHRHALGLHCQSLAWGAWAASTAMTSDLSDADRGRWGQVGIGPLSDEVGLGLLDATRALQRPCVLPVRFDSAALRAGARGGMLQPILSGIVRVPTRASRASGGELASKLVGVPEAKREAVILEFVTGHVAAVLGHSSIQVVDPQRPFRELGFDSLSAIELRNRLAVAAGVSLPSTLVFDYPTPVRVAGFLGSKIEPGGARGVEVEPGEALVREALLSIPLSRLRRAGLLDGLMELIRSDGEVLSVDDGDADGGDVDGMDAAELVRHAMRNRAAESQTEDR
jgi:acyl carrier protein